MTNKAIEDVLWRINYITKICLDDDNPITLPLRFINTEWGYGIVCAKGLWVTECDAAIAEEVIEEFNKRKMEEEK